MIAFAGLENVFGPGKLVLFQGFGVADRIVDVERPKWSAARGVPTRRPWNRLPFDATRSKRSVDCDDAIRL
jgi:hypothetical protein